MQYNNILCDDRKMSIISYYAQLFIFLTCKSLTLWQYFLSLWQRFVFFHVAGRKLVWRQHKQTCRRVKVTQKRDIPNRRRAPTSMDVESPPRARKVHFANYVADWWAQKTQTAPTSFTTTKHSRLLKTNRRLRCGKKVLNLQTLSWTYNKCAMLWHVSLHGYEKTSNGISDFGHITQPWLMMMRERMKPTWKHLESDSKSFKYLAAAIVKSPRVFQLILTPPERVSRLIVTTLKLWIHCLYVNTGSMCPTRCARLPAYQWED